MIRRHAAFPPPLSPPPATRSPRLGALMAGLLLAAVPLAAGCNLTQPSPINGPPVVFTTQPDLNQLMQAVNSASSHVTSFQTTGAQLSITGAPSLQASIAMERPYRFRLRAQSAFTGTELDLGSNEQWYWLWAKRNDPPAVYYGRHGVPPHSTARHLVPIPPHWLIEALGIVFFDPAAQHEGPHVTRPDVVEIRSRINTPMGPIQRSTLIDWPRAVVTEQHVYDASGQRLASAIASNFHHDLVHQVSLPRTVTIQLPTAQLEMTLEVYGHAINQLTGDPGTLFAMPQIAGAPMIDLSTGAAGAAAADGSAAPTTLQTGLLRMLPALSEDRPMMQTAERRQVWPFQRIR